VRSSPALRCLAGLTLPTSLPTHRITFPASVVARRIAEPAFDRCVPTRLRTADRAFRHFVRTSFAARLPDPAFVLRSNPTAHRVDDPVVATDLARRHIADLAPGPWGCLSTRRRIELAAHLVPTSFAPQCIAQTELPLLFVPTDLPARRVITLACERLMRPGLSGRHVTEPALEALMRSSLVTHRVRASGITHVSAVGVSAHRRAPPKRLVQRSYRIRRVAVFAFPPHVSTRLTAHHIDESALARLVRTGLATGHLSAFASRRIGRRGVTTRRTVTLKSARRVRSSLATHGIAESTSAPLVAVNVAPCRIAEPALEQLVWTRLTTRRLAVLVSGRLPRIWLDGRRIV